MELTKKYQVWYSVDYGYQIYMQTDDIEEALKLQLEVAGLYSARETFITKKPETRFIDKEERKRYRMKLKAGDRVQLVRKISDLPGSWIGRYGTVTAILWNDTAVSVTMDKLGKEKEVREVFTMAGNFILK